MIKKRLILLIIFLQILPFVNAGSIGITPAHYELFFEPNLERTFEFKASNPDSDAGIEIYMQGDLSEYFELSDTFLKQSGNFEVKLKLPDKIEIPGTHRIIVGVREKIKDINGGVGGLAAIQAVISVLVPYPGKYVEASFKILDINKGENAFFELELNNLGTQDVDVNPIIEIYENEKKLRTQVIEIGEIKSKDKVTISDFLETSDLSSGVYNVVVTIDYSKIITIEKELRIGYFFINITDYSYQFESKEINKFNIEVENLWNSEMNNVFAVVSVSDKGKILDDFKTPSVNMKPWEKVNLSGFFDASDVEEGKYTANIKVYYVNETISKLVAIYIFKPELNQMWLIGGGIALGIIVIILMIFLILFIKIIKLKKLAKNGKKK